MTENDIAVGRHEFGGETRLGAALDRDRNVEGAIEACEQVGLGMKHREGAQLATDRDAIRRMGRCSPVDHKRDCLAKATVFEIENGPIEAHPVQPITAHGHRALKRDALAPRRGAQCVEIVRANRKGHNAGTRQGRDATTAIPFEMLSRIRRDDLEIDRGTESEQAVSRPQSWMNSPRAGATPVSV
jgi:hypothetical protein